MPGVRSLAIPLALTVLLLAGCGGEDPEGPAPFEPEVTTSSAMTTSTSSAEPDGADGESSTGSGRPEAAEPNGGERLPSSIEGVIDAVMTASASAPAICDELVTEEYVRKAYGAREGCIAAQKPNALARSVQIEAIDERTDGASAVVLPRGGPYAGVEVEIELTGSSAEGWRVSSLLADVPAGP